MSLIPADQPVAVMAFVFGAIAASAQAAAQGWQSLVTPGVLSYTIGIFLGVGWHMHWLPQRKEPLKEKDKIIACR